jgi:TRAP-type C4-dicarboxylate transport system permease small subunit
MKIWKKVESLLDRIADVCGILGAGLILFIMLLISAGVFTRTAFNKPITGAEEIAQYSLLYCAFLMSIWLMKRNGHARVDLVISLLKPKTKALANIILYSVSAAICLILTWFGVKVVIDNLIYKVRESSYFMIPSWTLFIIIPVGMFLLFTYVVKAIINYRRDFNSTSNELKTPDPAETLEEKLNTEI